MKRIYIIPSPSIECPDTMRVLLFLAFYLSVEEGDNIIITNPKTDIAEKLAQLAEEGNFKTAKQTGLPLVCIMEENCFPLKVLWAAVEPDLNALINNFTEHGFTVINRENLPEVFDLTIKRLEVPKKDVIIF